MRKLFRSGQAGAIDEESFLNAFEDVPSVKLFSSKDLEEQMKTIKDTVGDDKKDWKQRNESVSLLLFREDIRYLKCYFYNYFADEKTQGNNNRGRSKLRQFYRVP